MSKKLKMRQCQKIDTNNNWDQAKNFIPLKGELIIYQEVDEDGKATSTKIKIGDGKTKVEELEFYSDTELIEVSALDNEYATFSSNEIYEYKEKGKIIVYLHKDGNLNIYLSLSNFSINKVTFEGANEGNKYYIVSIDNEKRITQQQVIFATKEELEQLKSENLSWENIQNKPALNKDTGENSIKFGPDAIASGQGAISAGTSGRKIAEQIYGSTIGFLPTIFLPDDFKYLEKELDTPTTASGEISFALGAGAQALSLGAISLGALTNAGSRGFYWHSIDFDNNKIILSTSQNSLSWNDNATLQLEKWEIGDIISIYNGETLYNYCSEITIIDYINHTIFIDSLPFNTSDKNSNKPISCGVFCPVKSNAGLIELGYGGFASGFGTRASGNFSMANGGRTLAIGAYSVAQGSKTKSIGTASHAEGLSCLTFGNFSNARGNKTKAYGECSSSSGENSVAFGKYSNVYGRNSIALGQTACARGNGANDVSNRFSVDSVNEENINDYILELWKETKFIMAKGIASYAGGKNTLALGDYSQAWGTHTIALGTGSLSNGYNTKAEGLYSCAFGNGTVATKDCQFVIGRYNDFDIPENYAFIIGGGKSDRLKNICTIDWNGNATFLGSLNVEKIIAVNGIQQDMIDTKNIYLEKIYQGKYYEPDLEDNYAYVLGNGSNKTFDENGEEILDEDGNSIPIYSNAFLLDKQGNVNISGNMNIGGNLNINGTINTINSDTIRAKTIYLGEVNIATALNNLVGRKGILNNEIFNDYINNSASGSYAHAQGYKTSATGNSAHSQGSETTANGNYSMAEGRLTFALGKCAHSAGYNTVSLEDYSFVCGKYNSLYDIVKEELEKLPDGFTIGTAFKKCKVREDLGKMEMTNNINRDKLVSDWEKDYKNRFITETRTGTLITTFYQKNKDKENSYFKYTIVPKPIKYVFAIGNGQQPEISTSNYIITQTKTSNAFTVDWDGNGCYAGTVEATAVILKGADGNKYKISINDQGQLVNVLLEEE